MEICKLYTDLINNPSAAKSYRELSKWYRQHGMDNEANAFLEVINDLGSHTDKEQRIDHTKMP